MAARWNGVWMRSWRAQGEARPPKGPAAVIGWTALSALIPGVAHLRAGRLRTGLILMGLFVLVLFGLVTAAVVGGTGLIGTALKSGTLNAIMVTAVLGALAWFVLVLRSYVVLGPNRLSEGGQILSGAVVGVLCVAVMAPFAYAANSAYVSQDALSTLFKSSATGQPINAADPWAGKDRVNFLLLGADWAKGRYGVRTDSITVVSVDVKTGNSVMLSLPRNLEQVRFPPGSTMAQRFPYGFPAPYLLNSVYDYAEENRQEIAPGSSQPGADVVKATVGHILGLKIDYYALVDMWGFAEMIDAIGGLHVYVEQDVYYGIGRLDGGVIKKGNRRLKGSEVLWYGRSRENSDDYSRMARQRCLIGAIAKQANPTTVLARFDKIASAAKRMFKTDIPRDLLEHLVPLALKVKSAKISSIQFVPPVIYTGDPDWSKIRSLAMKALQDSMKPDEPPAVPASTPDPLAMPSSPVGENTPTTSPTASPKAKRLDEVCAF